jgi:hypothetical protein
MTNTKSQTEIALSIKAALYAPRAWDKPMHEVAALIMASNMRRGVAGKTSPVAAKALARMEANGFV